MDVNSPLPSQQNPNKTKMEQEMLPEFDFEQEQDVATPTSNTVLEQVFAEWDQPAQEQKITTRVEQHSRDAEDDDVDDDVFEEATTHETKTNNDDQMHTSPEKPCVDHEVWFTFRGDACKILQERPEIIENVEYKFNVKLLVSHFANQSICNVYFKLQEAQRNKVGTELSQQIARNLASSDVHHPLVQVQFIEPTSTLQNACKVEFVASDDAYSTVEFIGDVQQQKPRHEMETRYPTLRATSYFQVTPLTSFAHFTDYLIDITESAYKTLGSNMILLTRVQVGKLMFKQDAFKHQKLAQDFLDYNVPQLPSSAAKTMFEKSVGDDVSIVRTFEVIKTEGAQKTVSMNIRDDEGNIYRLVLLVEDTRLRRLHVVAERTKFLEATWVNVKSNQNDAVRKYDIQVLIDGVRLLGDEDQELCEIDEFIDELRFNHETKCVENVLGTCVFPNFVVSNVRYKHKKWYIPYGCDIHYWANEVTDAESSHNTFHVETIINQGRNVPISRRQVRLEYDDMFRMLEFVDRIKL
jgi:hypothetical protein